ncbi:DUF7439 family protein [Pengzhenrongella sicca]|uniref:Uncharacterized protein n=1 Tax=Pengzhenrongella sicca TaxID=2819238 RepID=A0A8A4ZFZ5_9MICO|nr:hypothetical protein [Pengzhenrongella sicca]QTE30814.1 hypothetical protein J4E96_07755 [Pengzhenrongella sicca]
MHNLLALLPAAWRPYAKAVVAAVGTVLATISVVVPTVPSWVTAVVSALTTLGVFAQTNTPLPSPPAPAQQAGTHPTAVAPA